MAHCDLFQLIFVKASFHWHRYKSILSNYYLVYIGCFLVVLSPQTDSNLVWTYLIVINMIWSFIYQTILVNMLCTFIDFGWCTKKLCQQCLHFNPGKFLGGHGRSFIEKSTTTTKKTIKSHLGTLFGASLYDCLDDIQGPLTWDQEMDGEEESAAKRSTLKRREQRNDSFALLSSSAQGAKKILGFRRTTCHKVLILTSFVVIYLYLLLQ